MASGIIQANASEFWTNGYTIVRGVYSAEDIERFRQNALASRDVHKGDLLSNPDLQEVLLDGKLVQIAKQLLGRNEVVYYGDSSARIREGTPGWHKDNADRKDGNAPDWRSPYTQLRFGIYLQDHHTHGGGLNLRHRSHNTVDKTKGRCVHVRTRVGDVGVWNMRITHSAAGTLLKFPRWYHPAPEHVSKIPKFLIAPRDKERIALFLAIGAEDEHLDRYVSYLKTRTYIISIWRNSVYDEETLQKAASIGLKVRDMRSEIEGDETVGKKKNWAPFPY